MPTLANIQGRSLVADPSQALSTLLQGFGTPQRRAADEQRLSQRQQSQNIQAQTFQSNQDAAALAKRTALDQQVARFQALGQPVPPQLLAQQQAAGGGAAAAAQQAATSAKSTQALATIAQINQKAAAGVADAMARGATDELAVMKTEAEQGVVTANRIQGMATFQDKKKALAEEGVRLVQEGKDPQRILELSNMNEGQLDLELTKMDVVGNKMVEAIPTPQKIKGPADFSEAEILKIGITDPDFAGQILAARKNTATSALEVRKVELLENKLVFEKAKERAEALTSSAEVQSSKILEDGTTVFAMKDGTTLVNDALGQRVSGQAAADAVVAANEFGVDIQGQRSGERAGQAQRRKDNQAIATAAFKSLPPIRKGLGQIDRALTLLEKEGANTGPVDAILPSIQSASIELDNLMNQLGLNVVSSTTFGALSKGELDLALNTALPTGLEPKPLAAWLRRKRKAQTAALKQFRETAIHLRAGGDLETLIKRTEQQDVESGLIEAPAATAVGEVVEAVAAGEPSTEPEGTAVSDGITTFIVKGGTWQIQ